MATAVPDTILKRLSPDSLYIFLYRHPDPKIRYHWAFYHHANENEGGWKFDIVQPQGLWTVAVPYNGIPSPHVVADERWVLGCAVKLGKLDVNGATCPTAHRIIRKEDYELNEVDESIGWTLSCKVYVQRGCGRLSEAGLLKYTNWEELENEVLQTGDHCEKEEKPAIIDSDVAQFVEQG